MTTSGNPPSNPTNPTTPAGSTPPQSTLPHPEAVLDAAVWVSAAIPQEQQDAASRQWLDQFLASNGMLVIPEWFIAEVAAAVGRRVSPQQGQRAYTSVYFLSQIRIVPMSGYLM